MKDLNEVSLMVGLRALLNNNMHIVNKTVRMYQALHQLIHNNALLLPKDSEPLIEIKVLEEKLKVHLQTREKEFKELSDETLGILSNSLNFDRLYKQIITLTKKIQTFDTASFILPRELLIYFEKWGKVIFEIPGSSWQKVNVAIQGITQNHGAVESMISNTSQLGVVYFEFLCRLLDATCDCMARYLDEKLKQLSITITKEDTIASVLEKLNAHAAVVPNTTGYTMSSSDILRFKTELKLILSWNNGVMLNVLKSQQERFENLKKLALQCDKLLVQNKGIEREEYLSQGLDPTNEFVGGYCAFDILTWLKNPLPSSSAISKTFNSTQKKIDVEPTEPQVQFTISKTKSKLSKKEKFIEKAQPSTHRLTQYHDFNPINWRLSTDRIDVIDSNLRLNKDFLICDFSGSMQGEIISNKAVFELCEKLHRSLEKLLKDPNVNKICIVLGLRPGSHALGLKRLKNGGLEFRDVNQGTFRIQDLNVLMAWLPIYLKEMGYEKISDGFILYNLMEHSTTLAQDPIYCMASANIARSIPTNLAPDPVQEIDDFLLKYLEERLHAVNSDTLGFLMKPFLNAITYEREAWDTLLQQEKTFINFLSKGIMLDEESILSFEVLTPKEKHAFSQSMPRIYLYLSFIEQIEELLFMGDMDSDEESNEAMCELNAPISQLFIKKIEGIKQIIKDFDSLANFSLFLKLKDLLSSFEKSADKSDATLEALLGLWEFQHYRRDVIFYCRAIQNQIALEICRQKYEAFMLEKPSTSQEAYSEVEIFSLQQDHPISHCLFQFGKLEPKIRSIVLDYCDIPGSKPKFLDLK